MQPQFPQHPQQPGPSPYPAPHHAPSQYPPPQQYGQYGPPAFGPPFPPARRGNGRVWALLGGGVAVLVVLVIAVLAATGAFRSGPPHYTETQAIAHVRSAAVTSEVRGASASRIVGAMHRVCDGLSGGKTTVSRLMTSGNSSGGLEAHDGLLIIGTAIATYCPTYYGEVVAWEAAH